MSEIIIIKEQIELSGLCMKIQPHKYASCRLMSKDLAVQKFSCAEISTFTVGLIATKMSVLYLFAVLSRCGPRHHPPPTPSEHFDDSSHGEDDR